MNPGKALLNAVLVAVCLGTPTALLAEDLLDIYHQAQQSDPSLRAAEAAYKAALQGKSLARAPLKPQINANAGIERHSQTFSDTPASRSAFFRDSDFNRKSWGIRLDQTLYNKALREQLNQADAQIAKAEADLIAARQNQIVRVAKAYFDVLAAIDTVAFAKAEKAAIGKQLHQSKERFDVGLIAITDVKEAQAKYDLAVAQEISAQNQYDIAMEDLQLLIGRLPESLDPLQDNYQPEPPTPASIDAWVKLALDNSLALRAARMQLAIAKSEIARQKSGHYPIIGLKAQHGVQDDNGGFNEGKSGDTTVGVELKLPIYSGGQVSAATRQARANYQQALQQVELQRRETIRQTRAAYLNAIAGISRVKALKQALSSTRTAHETAKAGFEVGTRTAVDVLLALRETYRAKQDYARARYDYILQMFRLKQAAGILSEKDAKAINDWL